MLNPNIYDCFLPQNVLTNLPYEKRQQAAFSKNNIFDFKFSTVRQELVYAPKHFPEVECDPGVKTKFIKSEVTGELFCPNEFSCIKDKFKPADDAIVKHVSEEQGGFQLLRLIKSVPRLKFKLTPEQELMISTPQNLLCLGRSGTGKTTSSALRLFATEAFYKYHELLRTFK